MTKITCLYGAESPDIVEGRKRNRGKVPLCLLKDFSLTSKLHLNKLDPAVEFPSVYILV